MSAAPRLRIALLVNLAPRKRGSLEDWLLAIASAAQERGHALTVFGHEPLHADVARGLRSAGAQWRLLRELRARPLRAARLLARDFDVLHLNLLGVRTPEALVALAAWPARVLVVDHTSAPPGSSAGGADRRGALPRLLDRLTATRITGMAGVSEYVADRNRRRFDRDGAWSRAIYLGVDLSRYPAAPDRGPTTNPVRFITVAHLIPEKGVDVALQALSAVPDAELVVVGDGAEQGRLQALAAALGVRNRVEFLGLRDDVPELMRSCDVFLHPARWEEALGLVVLEAMAAARPVIGSRVGALPEMVEDGVTGYLVPPGAAEALAGRMRELAGDADLRARFGRQGRLRVESRFDVRASAAAHMRWCEEQARRHPGAPA